MTTRAIQDALANIPFRPFTVRLTDGRQWTVPAKEFAHVSPSGRTLAVYTADGEGMHKLDIALISEIEIRT